jgi:hypothetical protein
MLFRQVRVLGPISFCSSKFESIIWFHMMCTRICKEMSHILHMFSHSAQTFVTTQTGINYNAQTHQATEIQCTLATWLNCYNNCYNTMSMSFCLFHKETFKCAMRERTSINFGSFFKESAIFVCIRRGGGQVVRNVILGRRRPFNLIGLLICCRTSKT